MEIRKYYTVVEETISEMGKTDGTPLRKVGAVVIVKNPYAGKYQEDLSLLIEESKKIGRFLTDLAVKAMGEYPVESYGKGAVVGLDGGAGARGCDADLSVWQHFARSSRRREGLDFFDDQTGSSWHYDRCADEL